MAHEERALVPAGIPVAPREEVIEPMTKEEIERIYSGLLSDYTEFLEPLGVKAPPEAAFPVGKDGTVATKPVKIALQLVILRKFMGRLVHKDDVSEAVGHWHPGQKDSQVRHLGRQFGWDILNKGDPYGTDDLRIPSGWHMMMSTQRKKHGFGAHRSRNGAVNFDDLKEAYHNRCACCGSVEGRGNLRDPTKKTELQEGHMDPHQPLALANTIPQCQCCNQADRDKWVFDADGRVKTVASPEALWGASAEVKQKCLDYLRRDLGA